MRVDRSESGFVIETSSGTVEGGLVDGARAWLGIPYARAGRFEAPRPADPWPGTRPCHRFAAQCPQNMGGSVRATKMKAPGFDENCLHLNVWAPAWVRSELRPVLVWIHGGAFVGGAGDSSRGFEFAEHHDLVVVSINYRLGILGFVNFGDVLEGSDIPSNLGLRDQIAALRWVRDNIARFGGDPARVTIAGESAGAMSVCLLMHSPDANGLFAGAILQSGGLNLVHDQATSKRLAHLYLAELGHGTVTLEDLRTCDLKRLMDAQCAAFRKVRDAIPAAPWFDGDLVPASLDAAVAAPTPPIPVMAGANRDEIWLFDVVAKDVLPVSRERLEAIVARSFEPEQAARILSAYSKDKAGRRHLASDMNFSLPTLHFAERHAAVADTFVYRFDYAHPIAGATHALELAFVWPYRGALAAIARGGRLTGRRKALADRMKAHWASFAKTGAPRDDWPVYDVQQRKTLVFNYEDRVVLDPDGATRGAWNGIDAPVLSALSELDATSG
jgi:para-nitrobenzyl esterase